MTTPTTTPTTPDPAATVERLMALPMADWDRAVSALPRGDIEAIAGHAEQLAIRYARLAAYVEHRRWREHAAAVTKQNMVANHVRKAFGYHARHDITF